MDLILKLGIAGVLVSLSGLAASWSLLRGLKPRAVVAAGAMAVLLFFAAFFLLLESSLTQNTQGFFGQFFDETWTRQAQGLTSMGFSKENIETFKVFFQKYVFYSYPAWLGVIALVSGLVAYYLASSILSRISPKVPKAMAFREWIVPEPLVFGLILGSLFKLLFKENSPLDLIADNLLVFFVMLYALGGLSIVSFFFNKWKLPPVMRFLSYALFLNLVPETICVFGVLDVWFDFRKLKSAPPEPTPTA